MREYFVPGVVFVGSANAGERDKPNVTASQSQLKKHALNFKYHLLNWEPPSRVEERIKKKNKKRNVKKPAWNCHLLVNIPQLAGMGIHWIHYSLWIIRPDLTATVQGAFKCWDEEPLQTEKVCVCVTVPKDEYGWAPLLQEFLGIINVCWIPCLLHQEKI